MSTTMNTTASARAKRTEDYTKRAKDYVTAEECAAIVSAAIGRYEQYRRSRVWWRRIGAWVYHRIMARRRAS